VGFEPTIPAFERAKTVHALDRAATVSGNYVSSEDEKKYKNITTELLFKTYKKTIHLFINRRLSQKRCLFLNVIMHKNVDVPPKRRLTQDVHSATSQKTTLFIITAVKASNCT
jgi:hypothetical protein